MQTVDYYDVLQETADLCGLDRDNIGTVEQAILRALISKRLGVAWNYQLWPELCRIEKRWYRFDWNTTFAYPAGSEVFDPSTQLYYVALQDSAGHAPATSPTFWEVAKSLNPYISKDQVDLLDPYNNPAPKHLTPIGTVLGVWAENRRLTQNVASPLLWELSADGIQLLENAVSVWVEFRLRAPVLSGSKYLPTVYKVGSQVYYRVPILNPLIPHLVFPGNFYEANTLADINSSPSTTPQKWDLVKIPMMFKGYLEHGAAADFLMPQGEDEAGPHRAIAQAFIEDAAAVLLGQEGQTQRTTVFTR